MMFRLTLFNCITLFIMVLTLIMVALRLRAWKPSRWLLAYFAVLLGFAFGFPYSLNLWWVFGGIGLAWLAGAGETARPTRILAEILRWAELAVYGYVLWRCTGLLLMW